MSERFGLETPKGDVSAAWHDGGKRASALVVAHGAGAGMDHPFMKGFCEELAAAGVSALRFNFPYRERGSKRPDPMPVLEASIAERGKNAIIGGRSMGGRAASMLAADMSTDSSYMLTWGSILYNDIICPLRKQPFSERSGLLVNRIIILAIGAFLLIYGLWYQLPGRAWDYLSITANIYLSSISVLLIACCYWKGANTTGAIAAILGGAVSPIIFLLTGLAKNVEIAGLASFGLAVAGMLIGSWIGPSPSPSAPEAKA